MLGRWIAGAISLVTVAITGVFVWVVLNPPPQSLDDTSVPVFAVKTFANDGEPRTLRADVVPGAAGTVAVTVSITDSAQRPVTTSTRPTAALNMAAMAMGVVSIDLQPHGPGVWKGAGTLSMPGRWGLRVDFEDQSLHLPFEWAFAESAR